MFWAQDVSGLRSVYLLASASVAGVRGREDGPSVNVCPRHAWSNGREADFELGSHRAVFLLLFSVLSHIMSTWV